MAIRVTRQVIEILTSPPESEPSIRVTRQVIEILTSPSDLEPSIITTLSLTHLAEQDALALSTASILDLEGQTESNIKQIDIQNQLSLVQTADHNFKIASVGSVLSLIDEAIPGQDKFESLTNVLSLLSVADSNFKVEAVANILNIQQDIIVVINNNIIAGLANELSLQQTVALGPITFRRSLGPGISDPFPLDLIQTVQVGGVRSISIEDVLTLVQQVTINKNVNIDLTAFLSLAHELGRVFDESTSNILDLVQVAERVFSAANILDLVQTVVVFNPREAENTIALTQALSFLAEFARAASNTLNLVQTVGVRFDTISECLYDPQVGTGGISTITPTFGTATLTLTHPFVTPTTTLVLTNPNFGNTEGFQFSRINRESRGGALLIFRDPTWPERIVLTITVDFLKEAQKASLLQFFEDSLGTEIGLLDNENRQWKGIVVNPDAEVTQIGKDNYSVTFEFEGEIQ